MRKYSFIHAWFYFTLATTVTSTATSRLLGIMAVSFYVHSVSLVEFSLEVFVVLRAPGLQNFSFCEVCVMQRAQHPQLHFSQPLPVQIIYAAARTQAHIVHSHSWLQNKDSIPTQELWLPPPTQLHLRSQQGSSLKLFLSRVNPLPVSLVKIALLTTNEIVVPQIPQVHLICGVKIKTSPVCSLK